MAVVADTALHASAENGAVNNDCLPLCEQWLSGRSLR